MGRRRGLLKVSGLCALMAWLPSGCGTPADDGPGGPAFAGASVTVAVVGDPRILSTLNAQRGEWEASRGAKCVIDTKPAEPAAASKAHVLIFRGDRLGDLVDVGALAVLPPSLVAPPAAKKAASGNGPDDETPTPEPSQADPLQFDDVIPAYRDQVSKYGGDRIALPIGGSALVLVYNRSAFDSPAAKEAAKAAGVELKPPTTWAQLDALARLFHGIDWTGEGKNDAGIALAFGPDPEGLGTATYLARAVSLGQHRDHYSLLFDADTMAPRLTAPPFVEALEGLVALKAFGPAGVDTFDAPAARKAFRAGGVALLIDRAERASDWGGGGVKSVGVAALPGSPRVFEPLRQAWEDASPPNRPSYLPAGGGWLAAVSSAATGREREAAVDFITYLANAETSRRLRYDPDFPLLPVRATLVGEGLPDPRLAPAVESRSWAEAVGRTYTATRVVPGLRIPQADAYLADLDKGRVSAVAGEPAASALARVGEAWAARSDRLGRERQLWHYRRSLNALVTAPKPPPAAKPGL